MINGEKMVKVLGPIWVTLYLVIFRAGNAFIFVSLAFYFGVWQAALIDMVLYGVWATIFYLLLLQTESFEHAKANVNDLLRKRNWKIFIWLRRKIRSSDLHISPWWVALVFIVESPLTGVLLVRIMYPRQKLVMGLIWIWFGCFLEVFSWYLPLYGGGFTVLKQFLITIFNQL